MVKYIMKKTDIICFGGEDWWYHNRGHIDMQLMRRFARTGKVLYVNSIVMQKPKFKRQKSFLQKLLRKTKSILKGLRKSEAGFWVYSPFSLPVHHISWARRWNRLLLQLQLKMVTRKLGIVKPLIWVACPAACDIAIRMTKEKLIYQRTDRFEEYPDVNADVIRQYDRKLKSTADLTLFVSIALYHQEASQCTKALYLDHGVDFAMFADACNDDHVPDEIQNIPKPVIGFFGGIDDHTLDMPFMKKVVELLPEMSFLFIGNASSDCSGLLSRQNVRKLGQKPYEQIPHYGKCFDVAIMPWRQNRWIDACNPVKLKEYLALGKPVVSTPFSELTNYLDVVYKAAVPEQFAECIKLALAEDSPERISKRRDKIRNASWDAKADIVFRELDKEVK